MRNRPFAFSLFAVAVMTANPLQAASDTARAQRRDSEATAIGCRGSTAPAASRWERSSVVFPR